MDDNFRVVDVSQFRVPKIPWRNAAIGVVAIVALVAAAGTAFQVEPEEVGVVLRFGSTPVPLSLVCTSRFRL